MDMLNRQKRIHREVPGVVQCGVGPDFIDYDVQLRTDNGEMRVGVRLARMLLEDSQLCDCQSRKRRAENSADGERQPESKQRGQT